MTIFDNCIIQAPDGVVLSRCGRKKLNWYLTRDMADMVADDPPTIRLRFEPSGRDGIDDPLLLDGKPNVCVACGATDNLTRHHIIPYCFIRHMDAKYRMDIIRDILPLCRDCHDRYERKSDERRDEIAQGYGIPRHGIEGGMAYKVRKAMGAAKALLDHGDKIPDARRDELLTTIKEFLSKDEVTAEDLESLRKYRIRDREDYVSFSKHVADNVGDYNEFARGWRSHFVETMEPKHMPAKWQIDRKTEHVWVPERIRNQKPAR